MLSLSIRSRDLYLKLRLLAPLDFSLAPLLQSLSFEISFMHGRNEPTPDVAFLALPTCLASLSLTNNYAPFNLASELKRLPILRHLGLRVSIGPREDWFPLLPSTIISLSCDLLFDGISRLPLCLECLSVRCLEEETFFEGLPCL